MNTIPASAPSSTLDLQAPALSLKASLVPWDTELLGFAVGQIEEMRLLQPGASRLDLADFEAWREAQGLQMVSCRLPHGALAEGMLLEELGFRFVEMVYPLTLEDINFRSYPPEVQLMDATEADLDEIQEIANAAFVTGRFNVDPRLGPELGGRRYAGWVHNSYRDPAHRILKACANGQIVGFFIVENKGSNEVYWHLTAIAPNAQGKGMGRKVWQSMIMWHQAQGITRVRTTVSARNPAVMNLYVTLNCRFGQPQMTYHWLRP